MGRSWIYALWQAGDAAPLIMPGGVPLDSERVRSELTQYLEDDFKPVIDADIDGDIATPAGVDRDRPTLGQRTVTRRVARAIFLGSAATLEAAHKGIEQPSIWLGVAVPGDTVGNLGSALHLLSDRATYLYSDGDRYWYDTQATIGRVGQPDPQGSAARRGPELAGRAFEFGAKHEQLPWPQASEASPSEGCPVLVIATADRRQPDAQPALGCRVSVRIAQNRAQRRQFPHVAQHRVTVPRPDVVAVGGDKGVALIFSQAEPRCLQRGNQIDFPMAGTDAVPVRKHKHAARRGADFPARRLRG